MSKSSSRPQSDTESAHAYVVAGMNCEHCVVAVTEEVTKVARVSAVDISLETKRVRVHGTGVVEAAVVAAIDEAGYDAVAA